MELIHNRRGVKRIGAIVVGRRQVCVRFVSLPLHRCGQGPMGAQNDPDTDPNGFHRALGGLQSGYDRDLRSPSIGCIRGTAPLLHSYRTRTNHDLVPVQQFHTIASSCIIIRSSGSMRAPQRPYRMIVTPAAVLPFPLLDTPVSTASVSSLTNNSLEPIQRRDIYERLQIHMQRQCYACLCTRRRPLPCRHCCHRQRATCLP